MKNFCRISIFAAAAGVVAALSVACGSQVDGGDIPVLDVTKSYPDKNLILQDVAEVEYIPLETREGFLLDEWATIQYMDDRIMVTNNNKGDIIIFDRNTGKGLRSFNRHGRGPGEYPFPHIGNIAVDSDAGEMFVTLNSHGSGTAYLIYVYDMEGKPLRTIEFDRYRFPGFFHNYDSEHLFFLNSDTSQSEPYNLISKRDTVVTHLPIRFDGRSTMAVTQTTENSRRSTSRGNPLSKTRDGYMISEPGIDTMWRFDKATGEMTPVMAQTPSFHSMEYPIGMFYWAESSDYIFLQTFERKFDFDTNEGFKNVSLIYDKHSGEFFEGKILNTDYADSPPVQQYHPSPGVPAGTFVFPIQPYQLLDLHEAGKLRGRLAELAPTLKEEDNPVMMIVTFK